MVSLVLQVWTLIVAYMIVLIFWWTPSMSKVLPYFSIPVWIALLMHLASIAGAFGLPLFLVVMMLCFVGLVAELAENKKHGKCGYTMQLSRCQLDLTLLI